MNAGVIPRRVSRARPIRAGSDSHWPSGLPVLILTSVTGDSGRANATIKRREQCGELAIALVSGDSVRDSLHLPSSPRSPPQTARQALMEMFFSKTQGTFAKHLPAATRTALEKSGALANLQQYSLLVSQLADAKQEYPDF